MGQAYLDPNSVQFTFELKKQIDLKKKVEWAWLSIDPIPLIVLKRIDKWGDSSMIFPYTLLFSIC